MFITNSGLDLPTTICGWEILPKPPIVDEKAKSRQLPPWNTYGDGIVFHRHFRNVNSGCRTKDVQSQVDRLAYKRSIKSGIFLLPPPSAWRDQQDKSKFHLLRLLKSDRRSDLVHGPTPYSGLIAHGNRAAHNLGHFPLRMSVGSTKKTIRCPPLCKVSEWHLRLSGQSRSSNFGSEIFAR